MYVLHVLCISIICVYLYIYMYIYIYVYICLQVLCMSGSCGDFLLTAFIGVVFLSHWRTGTLISRLTQLGYLSPRNRLTLSAAWIECWPHPGRAQICIYIYVYTYECIPYICKYMRCIHALHCIALYYTKIHYSISTRCIQCIYIYNYILIIYT